jgi:hypothetical protein
MVLSKAKCALPIMVGLLDAVLIGIAYINAAPAWVYLVLLSAWWAGMPLYKRCFDEFERPGV